MKKLNSFKEHTSTMSNCHVKQKVVEAINALIPDINFVDWSNFQKWCGKHGGEAHTLAVVWFAMFGQFSFAENKDFGCSAEKEILDILGLEHREDPKKSGSKAKGFLEETVVNEKCMHQET